MNRALSYWVLRVGDRMKSVLVAVFILEKMSVLRRNTHMEEASRAV